jgi:hypothetical protein
MIFPHKIFTHLVLAFGLMLPASAALAMDTNQSPGSQNVLLEMIMNCSNRNGLATGQSQGPVGVDGDEPGTITEPVYVNCFAQFGLTQNISKDNGPTEDNSGDPKLNRHQRDFLGKSENSHALGASEQANIHGKFVGKVEFYDETVFWLGEIDGEARHEAIALMQEARKEAKELASQEIRGAGQGMNNIKVELMQEARLAARLALVESKRASRGIGKGK